MVTSGASRSGIEDQTLTSVAAPGGASTASVRVAPAFVMGVMETAVGEYGSSPGSASTAQEGTVDTYSSAPLSVESESYLGSVLTKDKPPISDREGRIRILRFSAWCYSIALARSCLDVCFFHF